MEREGAGGRATVSGPGAPQRSASRGGPRGLSLPWVAVRGDSAPSTLIPFAGAVTAQGGGGRGSYHGL